VADSTENDLILAPRLLRSGMEIKIRQAALADAQVIAAFNLKLAEESEGLR
jgi:hypothetical protein